MINTSVALARRKPVKEHQMELIFSVVASQPRDPGAAHALEWSTGRVAALDARGHLAPRAIRVGTGFVGQPLSNAGAKRPSRLTQFANCS